MRISDWSSDVCSSDLLALLDAKAGGAARVVAGDPVDAHAHQAGDVEAILDIRHQLRRAEAPRLHIEIRGAGRGRAGGAAGRMAGRFEAELAGRAEVEDPGGEAAVVDDGHAPVVEAFAVDGL